MNVLINNRWVELPVEALEIGSEGFAFEEGIYETMRTLNFKPVFLRAHLNRLFSTAKIIGLTIEYSPAEIRKMLTRVIEKFPHSNQRIRVLAIPQKLIIYTSHLNLDDSIYNGVKTITIQAKRNQPEIKSTKYESCLLAWKIANEMGCFDALLVNENGVIYEGSRSNVFWVKSGELFTRKGDVLPGITREIVIDKSPFPVRFSKLNKRELNGIDECFLTNSGSGIVPVVQVDDSAVGNGYKGEITGGLLRDYEKWIDH